MRIGKDENGDMRLVSPLDLGRSFRRHLDFDKDSMNQITQVLQEKSPHVTFREPVEIQTPVQAG